ncbi:MAG TPA: helix-turn-helix domain-containing protein [Pirellulales bacterium]|jgi:excisionase family DNA binding protein|nr:helix-turn-helix domain-containing protein [Pirellulales bacterium]
MSTAEIARSYVSPNELAAELGVSWSKVIGWIKSGELVAVNLAAQPGRRPQWRIARTDLELFLARRSATPTPRATRRRRKPAGEVIQFY